MPLRHSHYWLKALTTNEIVQLIWLVISIVNTLGTFIIWLAAKSEYNGFIHSIVVHLSPFNEQICPNKRLSQITSSLRRLGARFDRLQPSLETK